MLSSVDILLRFFTPPVSILLKHLGILCARNNKQHTSDYMGVNIYDGYTRFPHQHRSLPPDQTYEPLNKQYQRHVQRCIPAVHIDTGFWKRHERPEWCGLSISDCRLCLVFACQIPGDAGKEEGCRREH